MNPKILAFNLNPGRFNKLSDIAARLAISLRQVEKQDYGYPIAFLAGLDSEAAFTDNLPDFADEMLILCFFDKPKLSALLDTWRSEGNTPIQLKAVLTETNAAWHPHALHKEISEEAAWFRKYKRPKPD